MKKRKDDVSHARAKTPEDGSGADIERKQKKLKTAAIVAQIVCGALALVAVVVIAVAVCK